MMELGGNIVLDGFEVLEAAKVIVVKKIVGNYAKKVQESGVEFSQLRVELSGAAGKNSVAASVTVKDKIVSKTAQDGNVFVVLDMALKDLMKAVKQ